MKNLSSHNRSLASDLHNVSCSEMQRRSNHQNERENRGSGNHRDFKDAAKIGTRLSAEILGKDIEEEKYQSVP